MRLVLLPLLAVFAVGCNTTTKTDAATAANINSTSPYLWSDYTAPKDLKISTAFASDHQAAIQEMATAWTTSVNSRKTFFTTTNTTPEATTNISNLNSLYDGILGIYKTNPWPSNLPSSALAVTQIFGRRYNIGTSTEFVNIEHADILINFQLYTYRLTSPGVGFDLRTVIIHEMGHFIGLQHKETSSNRASSIMYPSIDPTENKQAPLAVDKSDIILKYNIPTPLTAESSAMVGPRGPEYEIQEGDAGEGIKILLELHADGYCVHKEDGVEVQRHPASVK